MLAKVVDGDILLVEALTSIGSAISVTPSIGIEGDGIGAEGVWSSEET